MDVIAQVRTLTAIASNVLLKVRLKLVSTLTLTCCGRVKKQNNFMSWRYTSVKSSRYGTVCILRNGDYSMFA